MNAASEKFELFVSNYLKTKERNSKIKTPGSKLADIEPMIEMDRDNLAEKAKNLDVDEDEKHRIIEDAIRQIRIFYANE